MKEIMNNYQYYEHYKSLLKETMLIIIFTVDSDGYCLSILWIEVGMHNL